MRLLRPSAAEAYYTSPVFKGERALPVPTIFLDHARRGEEVSAQAQRQYRDLGSFDVYFASSCRGLEDFQKNEEIINALEQEAEVALDRPLCVSAPLFLTAHDNREKGRLERWCVQQSACVFVNDGGKDTYGKDMEEAMARFIHGKPVVRFVEDGVRHRIMKDIHPLLLSGSYEHARGAHVVRSIGDAVRCLIAILLEYPHTRKNREGEWDITSCTLCDSLLEESLVPSTNS